MNIVTFQEPIPIVEMFLADYLQMWNGCTYQKEILQLISCSLHLQHFEGTECMQKNFFSMESYITNAYQVDFTGFSQAFTTNMTL